MSEEVIVYFVAAGLLLSSFIVGERRWERMRRAAVAELREKFFPPLIDNLKTLDGKLGESDLSDEDYLELLGRGWKSTLILDFHRYYPREEGIFASLKQDLEGYRAEVGGWKKTGDARLGEKAAKRKAHIREELAKLTKKLEELK